MQLRNVRDRKTPELIIIPMIDIMFFLLVFFMLSTMYMIDLKTAAGSTCCYRYNDNLRCIPEK